ncbi:MAG: hypothetical protein M1826_007688 [Phylliscum demangeonii]|nr:MAG: hypothetical protein M1826_007688 [Phylliscum demangeonii]
MATSVGGVRTRETAETGQTIAIGRSQDGIYGPAAPPAHNDATLVTSRDQGAVNVHPRSCCSLSCHIPLGSKPSWGKSPR